MGLREGTSLSQSTAEIHALTHEPSAPKPTVLRIRPSAGWRAINLAELWRYRELLWFLAIRDVKLRYKQTALGVAWVVLQPLLTTAVFTLFFGRLGGLAADLPPGVKSYPLFVLVALLPWQLFVYALSQSSNSLVAEQRLITKVYFPRLLVPAASVLAGLVDFLVTFVLVLIGIVWAEIPLTWAVLAVPALALFALVTALAVGLWLSALNVQYRDIKYTMPFLTQFWMLASPIAYSAAKVPEPYKALYGINPLTGIVEGFRWAVLGTPAPDWAMVAVSAVVTLGLLVGGLLYFRRMEKTFADVV